MAYLVSISIMSQLGTIYKHYWHSESSVSNVCVHQQSIWFIFGFVSSGMAQYILISIIVSLNLNSPVIPTCHISEQSIDLGSANSKHADGAGWSVDVLIMKYDRTRTPTILCHSTVHRSSGP